LEIGIALSSECFRICDSKECIHRPETNVYDFLKEIFWRMGQMLKRSWKQLDIIRLKTCPATPTHVITIN